MRTTRQRAELQSLKDETHRNTTSAFLGPQDFYVAVEDTRGPGGGGPPGLNNGTMLTNAGGNPQLIVCAGPNALVTLSAQIENPNILPGGRYLVRMLWTGEATTGDVQFNCTVQCIFNGSTMEAQPVQESIRVVPAPVAQRAIGVTDFGYFDILPGCAAFQLSFTRDKPFNDSDTYLSDTFILGVRGKLFSNRVQK